MQTKKLASALAFTAVAVNMVASVALAVDVTGTQDLACDPVARTFGVRSIYQPDNFQVGDDGTRPVSSSNDTSYVEATNSAYFNETADGLGTGGVFDDTVDALRISSNTPYSCSSVDRSVQLVVSATNFVNGSSEGLLTYGADGAAGGTGTDADYYAILSVITSANTTCSAPCVLAASSTESSNGIKHGENNFFDPTSLTKRNDNTLAAGYDTNSELIRSAGTLNPVTLYSASHGFEGDIDVPGLDYNLAMPANPEFTGSFTSTVTYTLS